MFRFARSLIAPIWAIAISAPGTTAAVFPRAQSTSDVHLAISPNCGTLSSPSPVDVNQGLKPLTSYSKIVAFGDSYTSGSVFNGSALPPPVLRPPNPSAGGRVSNGALWIEHLANAANATLEDWAVNGSVVDSTLYVGIPFPPNTPDFLTQVNKYIGMPVSDVDETLYVIFMGMGDYELRNEIYNKDLLPVSSSIAYGLLQLNSNPVFAKDFLIIDNYGRGTQTPDGDAYKRNLFNTLNVLGNSNAAQNVDLGMNIGFVDFSTLWDGVLGDSPGYEAFGYTNPGACLSNDWTTVGACADSDHTFYWIPGNPSKVTHAIMADYVQEVLSECTV